MELIETLTDKQFNRLVFLEKYLRIQKKRFNSIPNTKFHSTAPDIKKLHDKLKVAREENNSLKHFIRKMSSTLMISVKGDDSMGLIMNRILAEKLRKEEKYKKQVFINNRLGKEVGIWKSVVKELAPDLMPEMYARVDDIRKGLTPAPSIEAASFCKERAKDRAESEQGTQL
jgi:hypothetical protein